MFNNLRCHSKWVHFQIRNTHIRAFSYWSHLPPSPPPRSSMDEFIGNEGGGGIIVVKPYRDSQSGVVPKGLVINYGEERATKWENLGSETFCIPPQDRVKLFARCPVFKSGNFLRPPFNMAKTSSYRVKALPQNILCPPPPFSMAKTFSSPPLVRRGNTSHAPPPLPFCSPLPVISDQSLMLCYTLPGLKKILFTFYHILLL